MSRDRTDLDLDATPDDAAAEALNAYLDATALDGRPATGPAHPLAGELVLVDRRLRTIDRAEGPPPGLKALTWDGLMAAASAPTPNGRTNIDVNDRVPAASANPPRIAGRTERRRTGIVPILEFAAAVALLVGFAGLVAVLRARDESGDNHGAASPAVAAPASPTAGVRPVRLRIAAAGVDAPIEPAPTIELSMPVEWPDPWTVVWDEGSATLGQRGNVVLAGHLDYWDVGPAVFFDLRLLRPGDEIEVIGADDVVHVYVVEELRTYSAEGLPAEVVASIVGPTADARLTLITEAGEFDDYLGQYTEFLVVRAGRVEITATPVATPANAIALTTPAAAGCRASPRTAEEIAAIDGDPTIRSALPAPEFPGGLPQLPVYRADLALGPATVSPEAAAAGVAATLLEFAACRALGTPEGVARIWGLHSEDFFRRYDPGERPAPGRAWWGGPGDREGYELATVELLPDGRARAWLVFARNADRSVSLGVFAVFVEQDGRWLVDEVAVYGGSSDPAHWPPVPLPGECVVAPRSAESLAQVSGTPVSETFGPSPGASVSGNRPLLDLPHGPADQAASEQVGTAANVAQLRDTARLLAACVNAGDAWRRYALFSDDYVRRARLAGRDVPDSAELAAPPMPLPSSERVEAPALVDGIVLPDGRFGYIALDWPLPPEERIAASEAAFVVFVQEGDRWLIDEVVLQRDALVVEEPTPFGPSADVDGTPDRTG